MEDSNSFGSWLEQRLEQRGFTKAGLAERLGVARSVITMWTTGETEPAKRHIAPLARALGTTRYEIYLRLGHIEPRSEDIDPAWDIFIQRVEADGKDFRDLLLGSLDAMRRAWLARPRKPYAVMRISIEGLFEPSPDIKRGPKDIIQGSRLLMYDTVPCLDGVERQVLVTIKPEKDTYTIIVLVVSKEPVRGGMLQIGDDIYYATTQGRTQPSAIEPFPPAEGALLFTGITLGPEITGFALVLTDD